MATSRGIEISAPWPVPMARWARRRRTPIAAIALTLVVAATAAAFTSSLFRTTVRGEAIAKYARLLDKDDLGHFAFRQFVDWTPTSGDPAELAARKLHPYDVIDGPDWRRRNDVTSLPEPDRTDLEMLVLEQVHRIASAWTDRPDSPGDWTRALALLDRESRHACNPTFDALRASLRSRLGKPSSTAEPASKPVPPWIEVYLAGVAIEAKSAREALSHFERAVEARPDLLWPRYRAASTAYRLAKYDVTARHLRVLTGRRPESPALHTQLAAALFLYRKPDQALGPVDRAIAIDPEFAEAYRNRALLDTPPALDRGPDAARFAVLKRLGGVSELEKFDLQALTLRVFGRSNDLAPFTELARKILAVDPTNPDFRCVQAILLARSKKTREALAEYDAVLRAHPDHLRARYGRLQALLSLDRAEAVDEATQLIEDPRFEELYSEDPQALLTFHRVAYELVKQGRLDQARTVAERGLIHSRRTLLYEAESLYSLARVDATDSGGDPARIDLARDRLRQAVDLSPTLLDWSANDDAFATLRQTNRLRPKLAH